MKRFGCFLLLGLLFQSLSTFAGRRDSEWKAVDRAMKEGLPQTAITNLQSIIKEALADKAYPEAVKAIARKIVLEGNIEGNKPEEKILRVEKELATAPPETKPIFETILAHWYWQYFSQNRWRFMQRTRVSGAPGKDFTTWDLPHILTEIDKHFSLALAEEKILKATPISAYKDLLVQGTVGDDCRPTLYDFIVYEALSFYTAGEQAGLKVEDSFEVLADGEIFAPAEKFISWEPKTTDTNSPSFKAIKLFQSLLKFHQHDGYPAAFVDADISRFLFAKNIAAGESKDSRFKAAMQTIAEKWDHYDISTMAVLHWAEALRGEGDLVKAHAVAQQAADEYPKGLGGKMCRNLVLRIESKSAQIATEHVWNAPLPTLSVRYKNVRKVFFRAIPWRWETFLEKSHHRPESLSDQELKEVLKAEPARQWSHDLPPTNDFKERTEEVPAPENLPAGFYFIVASYDPSFSKKNNEVSITDVWVSDLALIVRNHEKQLEGFVLDARSGEPVIGATVQAWSLNNNGQRVALNDQTTDDKGLFSFGSKDERDIIIRAKYKDQQVATSEQYYFFYQRNDAYVADQTYFFTDRALYRPGQTIQFKGICVHVDQRKNSYEALPGRQVTVGFFDQNGKEIAHQDFRCNDYGSFAGSFVAARDRVSGYGQIRTVAGPDGQTSVRVEEYKRPKFQVTLDAPKVAAKLGERVVISGHAMNYTGAAVDVAPVKFRVSRTAQMPDWFSWFGWRHGRIPHFGSSQLMTHGTLKTEADGSFKIEFVAKPDPAVPEEDEPKFLFEISADVTDSAGETRSGQRAITLGYTTLAVTMNAADWQTENAPVAVKITTQTLDGEPQAAEGSVKVYALRAPEHVHRAPLPANYWQAEKAKGKDHSNPNNWELADVVTEKGFSTDKEGKTTLSLTLPAGVFRAELKTQDRFGKKVSSWLPLQVLRPKDKQLGIKIPHLVAVQKNSWEPGEEFLALWGTGYESGRAFVEIEHRGKMIERFWTTPGQTQQQIKMALTEKLRGGFTLHITQLRENRAYLESRRIDLPWSNKELNLRWEHFTSRMEPKERETWTAIISGSTNATAAEKMAAEMVATLYDASLDAYAAHQWMQRFGFFYEDTSNMQNVFSNQEKVFQHAFGNWEISWKSVRITYRHFPEDIVRNYYGYGFPRKGIGAVGGSAPILGEPEWLGALTRSRSESAKAAKEEPDMPMASAPATSLADTPGTANFGMCFSEDKRKLDENKPAANALDLNKVSARKNLNETAFFFPQLTCDSNGTVQMTFTMPEALTEWKFLGFAHDAHLRSGLLEGKSVTAKELMVQPNPPRFLREDDTIEFTVKVSNQSETTQRGKVRLTFNDALTDSSADKLLKNAAPEETFEIPAKESRSFSWRIVVPDGLTTLSYKAVGATEKFSDGEEGFLPILSRRVLITESLPLSIRGPAQKKFEFKKLLEASKSRTLRNQNLTVQMVSNPSWYAVLALPYLMEFPHECSEQTFNRFYANALARHIAQSDPKIHKVFEQWRYTPALDSPLEKNQDLKRVLLQETPWVRQAESESQARKNIGILFDDNRLDNEAKNTFDKLRAMQLENGSWPWFPDGRGNDYITLYIMTGFGRLKHLGLDVDMQLAVRALNRLDEWTDETYREILRHNSRDQNNLTPTIALYLYGRSFFLKDHPLENTHREAVDYFLGQARKFWLQLDNRQSQGHLALALFRFNDKTTATAIMKSIRERSVTSEEMGMFWRETELSWWWYRAPIETQALMIEAFDEIMNDSAAVEECKVWLLKQKQTQDWKTTKATADAVYALLLRGGNNLASDSLVEVSLGGNVIKPEKVEAGTGFYEKKFSGPEIKPSLGKITVKKVDQGVAWGSVHWQYLEDLSKVTPYEGTPLKLKKTIFTKVDTKSGPTLEPLKKNLSVGDEVVVRIELRVDRDMEYVHLKDQRGSGLEPVNGLSEYHFQDGLAYYESTRDTASHFFIDYLPKGVYVFEYSTRVQHRGVYQSGVAEIQCMYAPEFNSHSESFELRAK